MSSCENETIEVRQWASFHMGNECYALPATDIREIIPLESLSVVPGGASDVSGIFNFRGSVITVFSGSRMLGLGETDMPDEAKILVLELHQQQFGMTVDRIGGLISFSLDDIDIASQKGLIRGTIKNNGKLIIVLNLNEYMLAQHQDLHID